MMIEVTAITPSGDKSTFTFSKESFSEVRDLTYCAIDCADRYIDHIPENMETDDWYVQTIKSTSYKEVI